MASDGGHGLPDGLALQDWLRGWLSVELGIAAAELDADQPLRGYGLDSHKASRLIVALSAHLERELPFDLIWSHPSLAALGASLSEAADGVRRVHDAVAAASPSESIAVIGLSCRLPGADNPAAYWALLREGRCAISEVPPQRSELRALRVDASPGARFGGFLSRVDGFDARFFGIAPREAAHMDPQQRLMLELAWEALEDAGIAPSCLRGSDSAVFAGVAWSDYLGVMTEAGTAGLGPYSATGTHHSIIANRISYVLGLQGPSMAIDSACSSSLVAVHLACQSLRAGETRLALVGAANLILSPHSSLAMARLGALSPSGRLAAFDAGANGYVRGEGGGVVVLKRLSHALADGDAIYCVIRGSAVNNDGRSNGLTAPNPRAQVEVLRTAYARAGVVPAECDYVEAHGTGTELGDPIELGALGEVLGAGRPCDRPLRVGSTKTNLGHLEAAAGIAGLIKLALCIEHDELPASLHCEQPTARIRFERLGLEVPSRLCSWPRARDGERWAGVSAFGFGGTNCHVVVSAPAAEAAVLPLEASSPRELRAEARRLCALLTTDGPALAHPLAPTAPAADGVPRQRAALHFRSREELRTRLAALGAAQDDRGADRVHARQDVAAVLERRIDSIPPRIAFVCPPQGAQGLGMARRLLETEPAFLSEVAACDRSYARLAGWSLLEALRADAHADRLLEFEVVQPLLFTVSVGLAAVLRAWGVRPDAIIGHSLGEIAAAHLAGALDRAQALEVVHHYARALGAGLRTGKMAVVELSAAETASRLAGREAQLCIAGLNGPTTSLISGDGEALRALARELTSDGVFCSVVDVDAAAHSPHMHGLAAPLERALAGLSPGRARIPLISCVTASFVEGPELGAPYWPANLCSTVRFAEGVARLIDTGITAFVELGPHPSLCRQIAAIQQAHGHAACALGTLRKAERDPDDRRGLLETAAALYVRGVEIDWHAAHRGRGACSALVRRVVRRVVREAAPLATAHLVPLSARSEAGLRALAGALADVLPGEFELGLGDVAHSLARHRDHHAHRLAVVANDALDLRGLLSEYAAGERGPRLITGRTRAPAMRTAFVFSGQGSQWLGMGQETYRSEPVFQSTFDRCQAAIAPRLDALEGRSLLECFEQPAALDRVELVQPAIFALQVSLAALFRSWGIEPAAVVGHSMGEIAAATVAGILSLDDAAEVVCARSRIVQRTAGQGGMALIELPVEQLRAALASHAPRLSIAASNGPSSTVVSGEPAAIAALLAELEAREVFCRLIRVNYASHSAQMEPFLPELRSALKSLRPQPGSTPFLSTVTGRFEPGSALSADYWARNLREPVLFWSAVEALGQHGCQSVLELSPHPILVQAIAQNIGAGSALPSLVRARCERTALLAALGALYARGHELAWPQLARGGERFVRLPTYPWQRERCWLGDPVAESSSPAVPVRAALSDERSQAGLVQYLTALFAGILRLRLVDCAPETALTALGLDSLTAAEARARIEAELAQRCPLLWLLSGSIERVAASLAREAPRPAPLAARAAYPLSEAQRLRWLGSQLPGEAHAQVIHRALRVGVAALAGDWQSALHGLTRRHELLRLEVSEVDGAPSAALLEDLAPDFTKIAVQGDLARALPRLCEEAARALVPGPGRPLLRARLLCPSRAGAPQTAGEPGGPARQTAVLLVSAHRMIADHTALEVLAEELVASLCGVSLATPQTTYRDYLGWLRGVREVCGVHAAHKSGAIGSAAVDSDPPLALRTDRARPVLASHRAVSSAVELPVSLHAASGSPPTLLLCAWWVLLQRNGRAQSDRVSIGVLVDPRRAAGCLRAIGPCSSPVTLHARLPAELSVDAAVAAVAAAWSRACAAGPDRQPDAASGVGAATLFTWHERSAPQRLPEPIEWIELTPLAATVDLSLEVERDGPRLRARIVAAADLFRAPSIRALAAEFSALLSMMTRSPDLPLAALATTRPRLDSRLAIHAQRAATLADDEPRGPVEASIAALWQGLLGVSRVGRADDFFSLGGDRFQALQLRARLRATLDVELSFSSILANPTVHGLAAQVVLQAPPRPPREGGRGAAGKSASDSWLVPLRPEREAGLRLICFPHAGGGPAMYRSWADDMAVDIDLFALCLPGRETRLLEAPYQDIFRLCAEIARVLGALCDRPLAFFGHSLGALLAFETARLLRAQSGVEPARLFVAGFPAADRWQAATPMQRVAGADLSALLAALGAETTPAHAAPGLLNHALLRSDLDLLFSHRYVREAPLSCPISAFGGRSDRLAQQADLEAWRSETTSSFSLRRFAGDHFFLGPRRRAVIKALHADLQQTDARCDLGSSAITPIRAEG